MTYPVLFCSRIIGKDSVRLNVLVEENTGRLGEVDLGSG